MNIDDLLKITPSKEGKIKIIINAVEKGLTKERGHLQTAMKHYEKVEDYSNAAKIAEQLGDNELAELYRSCFEEK